MERHQYVSVVRLLDVLLERCNHISKGCSNDVPSVCLHDVSDETPNNVSVVHHQDASVARIHDVRLARLYNVPCKSQIKHPKTLLWYVSTMSRSYFFVMPCQQVSNTHSKCFVITLQVPRSNLSINSNTRFLLYQPRGKQKEQFGL